LSQLLETSIGDVDLFKRLSGLLTGKLVVRQGGNQEIETQLWDILDLALAWRAKDKNNGRLIIVVDGFDAVVGGAQKATSLHNRLREIVKKNIRVRAITFSRPISHLGGVGCKHLVVTADHIRDDIAMYFEEHLSKYSAFSEKREKDRLELIEMLVNHAKGSFLFAYIAMRWLKTGLTINAFEKAIRGIKAGATDSILAKLFEKVNTEDADVKSILSFALVATRPLATGEMADLLSVNISKKVISDHVSMEKLLSSTHGLVIEQRGVVRFTHSIIRDYIVKHVCGSSLPSLREAHTCLTLAMLFLARCSMPAKSEPSLEPADGTLVQTTLGSRHVLLYVVNNWISHFNMSTLIAENGSIALTSGFKSIFPDATFFSTIEWACWQDYFGVSKAVEMHELSLRIREACFSEKHRCVMQNLVVLGSLQRNHLDIVKASEYFYRATTIGQVVLTNFSPFVMSCANTFLVCTDSITITERTTIVTYRETIIKYTIEVYKRQYGVHSDVVIRWLETLAQLYVSIKETHHATIIYREIREIMIIRFGPTAPETRRIVKALAGMSVTLNKDATAEEIEQVGFTLFTDLEEPGFDIEIYVSYILQTCVLYELHRVAFVERLYLNLWCRICDMCLVETTAKLHLLKLEIALKYITFLRRIGRKDEACSIMVCVWAEYEHYECQDQMLIIRLKELAVIFRSFGMFQVAISILKKAWLWFKERKLIEHEEAASTTIIISEVVEEITETIIEKKTTTTVTETITREVWETTYTRCKGGKVDHHFFKTALALANLYIKLEKWSEVEVVIRKSLEISWKAVLESKTKIVIEGEFILERISVATRLALCYHRQRHFARAEEIYLRIFHACFESLKCEHSSLMEATLVLVTFYEDYHRHDKVVEIYVTLLEHFRKHLGHSHKLTVKILYKLAAVYELLGRAEAYDCYIEIVTIYTKDGYCHHDARDAAIIVLNYYHRECRWIELQKLCVVLWETFTKHHHECTFTEEMISIIYERYRYVLEVHSKVEFSILYKLTVEYREMVTKVFGISASIVITAMMVLAELCGHHEEHYHESVTIYEEIIKTTKTTTTVTETTITTVKKRLSKMYVTIIHKGGKITTTTIERAIEICLEMYEHLKVEFGWWHEKTLLHLKELVLLYKKHNHKDSRVRMLVLVQASLMEIITTCTVSMTLYTAATTLGSIFVECGLVKEGRELLQQLQYYLLFPNFDYGPLVYTSQPIERPKVKISRVSLVFLVAFDQALTQKKSATTKTTVIEFSHLMSEIMLETILYEQYAVITTTITKETRIDLVLEHAARLRCVWVSRKRDSFVKTLDKKIFSLFVSRHAAFLDGYSEKSDEAFELYVALMFEIGSGVAADQSSLNLALLTCRAVNGLVRRLVAKEKADLARAHAVARCAFQFANAQGYYRSQGCFVYGFRLAEMLAGRGIPTWKKADQSTRDAMVGTSKAILSIVLATLKESGVKLVELRSEDLTALVQLLGEQKNYQDLEVSVPPPSSQPCKASILTNLSPQHLLLSLWQSREFQRTWSSPDILHVASLLIHAHVLASHSDRATALCRTIFYNLRRSLGGLAPETLHFASRLIALLYRSGRFREALRIHLDVVTDLDDRMIERAREPDASAEMLKDPALAKIANAHLDGLRKCGFAKGGEGVKALGEVYSRVAKFGELEVVPVEEWTAGAGVDMSLKAKVEAEYKAPNEWVVGKGSVGRHNQWVCGVA